MPVVLVLACLLAIPCPALFAQDAPSAAPPPVQASQAPSAATVPVQAPQAPSAATTPEQAFQGPVPAQLKVEVGIYVLDISRLDVKQETFEADFYIWFKWTGPGFSPSGIEFMNGEITHKTEPTAEITGGKNYSIMRVKGAFRTRFMLSNYPFDVQTLRIVIEHKDLTEKELQFVPAFSGEEDASSRTLEKGMIISDWKVSRAWGEVREHKYNTDFGYFKEVDKADYSQYLFNVTIKRSIFPYLLKFSLPLFILVIMSFLVFFINAKEFEAQCGICVTAILSCIALHLAQGDSLPQVGYLVAADKFFILSYILIFFTLVETVICNNYAKKGFLDKAANLDNISIILFPAVFLVGLVILLYQNL